MKKMERADWLLHKLRRVHPLVVAGDGEVDMGLQGLFRQSGLAHRADGVAAGYRIPGGHGGCRLRKVRGYQ